MAYLAGDHRHHHRRWLSVAVSPALSVADGGEVEIAEAGRRTDSNVTAFQHDPGACLTITA